MGVMGAIDFDSIFLIQGVFTLTIGRTFIAER